MMRAQARATLEEFLKRYPHNELAGGCARRHPGTRSAGQGSGEAETAGEDGETGTTTARGTEARYPGDRDSPLVHPRLHARRH